MSAGRVLLRKELLESWRTLRLPIVAGLFLLVGLTSPLLAKFLPEIITAAPATSCRPSRSRHRSRPMRPTSSGRTSPSSARSRRSSWRWAPWPTERTAARPRSSCRNASRAARSSAPRSRASGWCSPPASLLAVAVGLVLHRGPVRAAAHPRLGRPGRPGVARPLGVGGHHLPRQHGHRLRRGRGRRRVRGAPRAVDRLGRAGRRALPARRPGRSGRRDGCGRAGRPRRCPGAGHLDGRPDRRGRRSRGLVVPPPGALSATVRALRRPRRRATRRPPRGRSRARRGSRRCPGRGWAAASGSSAGVAASVNGMPACRITPQAGCSCSTVIPSATASGDAKAAATSLIGPARDLGHVQDSQPVGRRSAGEPRGQDGAQLGSSLDPVAVGGEPGVAREVGQTDRHAEPRPLALGPGRDRDRAVGRREGLVRHDVRVGVAEPARRDTTDEGVLGLVDQDRQGRPQQRHVDPLAATGGRPVRPLPPDERGQDPDRAEHPRHDVADGDPDLGRLATRGIRGAGDRHQSAGCLDHEVVAGPVRGGPVVP